MPGDEGSQGVGRSTRLLMESNRTIDLFSEKVQAKTRETTSDKQLLEKVITALFQRNQECIARGVAQEAARREITSLRDELEEAQGLLRISKAALETLGIQLPETVYEAGASAAEGAQGELEGERTPPSREEQVEAAVAIAQEQADQFLAANEAKVREAEAKAADITARANESQSTQEAIRASQAKTISTLKDSVERERSAKEAAEARAAAAEAELAETEAKMEALNRRLSELNKGLGPRSEKEQAELQALVEAAVAGNPRAEQGMSSH